ncbi:cytochrome o ubiquinol oxidase subunit IV [Buchnera aphidicola]|uniref:cytochrome o ubiquinol oxidase subunit IV n=1 Tax=Buchnera aphidicola TaxID=9 RepID=UPI0032EBA7B7
MDFCIHFYLFIWSNFMNLNNRIIIFMKTSLFFYIIVFLISLLLSFLPFYFVIKKTFSKNFLYFFVIFCCFLQVFIHILFFLHLNDFNKNYWNVFSIIFTFLVITIIVSGSIWIMRNLNHYVIFS